MFYNCLHVLVLDITAYTFFLPYNYYQVYLYCLFQSAVTCLIWPFQQSSFVFGQADGKVKLGGAKGSKSQTLYAHDSYVVSLASRLVSLSLSSKYEPYYSILPYHSSSMCQSLWQRGVRGSC